MIGEAGVVLIMILFFLLNLASYLLIHGPVRSSKDVAFGDGLFRRDVFIDSVGMSWLEMRKAYVEVGAAAAGTIAVRAMMGRLSRVGETRTSPQARQQWCLCDEPIKRTIRSVKNAMKQMYRYTTNVYEQ